MCSASVDPMPSSTGWPVSSLKRRCSSAGNASPAVIVSRTDANVSLGTPASRRAATNPGAAKNSVGCSCTRSSATPAGVGRTGFSTALAPTEKGNVSELPRP